MRIPPLQNNLIVYMVRLFNFPMNLVPSSFSEKLKSFTNPDLKFFRVVDQLDNFFACRLQDHSCNFGRFTAVFLIKKVFDLRVKLFSEFFLLS